MSSAATIARRRARYAAGEISREVTLDHNLKPRDERLLRSIPHRTITIDGTTYRAYEASQITRRVNQPQPRGQSP